VANVTYFWNLSKYKTWREKVEWTWHIIPTWKSGGDTSPTKLRPWPHLSTCFKHIVKKFPCQIVFCICKLWELTVDCWYCCNLSGGVALIVWFTVNGMCVKNNTIICVPRASNSKRDCAGVALLILTCERLNVTTSVRKERLRAWSLLLLAATVRSFAHMPLGLSDRNSITTVVCHSRPNEK